jgi:hypothetical protein
VDIARKQPRKSRSRQPDCQTRCNPTPGKSRIFRLLRLTSRITSVFFTTSSGERAIRRALRTRSASSLLERGASSCDTLRTTTPELTASTDRTATREHTCVVSRLRIPRDPSHPEKSTVNAAPDSHARQRREALLEPGAGSLERGAWSLDFEYFSFDVGCSDVPMFDVPPQISPGSPSPRYRTVLAACRLPPPACRLPPAACRLPTRLIRSAHLQKPGPFARIRVFLRESPCWGESVRAYRSIHGNCAHLPERGGDDRHV